MAATSATSPANAAEHARLQNHLRAVLRLRAGCDNPNTVMAHTVRLYASIVDELVTDVAAELHRAIATDADSASRSVFPEDVVVAGFVAAAAAQEVEAARLHASGFFRDARGTCATAASGDGNLSLHRSRRRDERSGGISERGPTTRFDASEAGLDVYGRGPGASTETAGCPLCASRVAASRFAHHLERCLGKGRLAARRRHPPTRAAHAAPLVSLVGEDGDDVPLASIRESLGVGRTVSAYGGASKPGAEKNVPSGSFQKKRSAGTAAGKVFKKRAFPGAEKKSSRAANAASAGATAAEGKPVKPKKPNAKSFFVSENGVARDRADLRNLRTEPDAFGFAGGTPLRIGAGGFGDESRGEDPFAEDFDLLFDVDDGGGVTGGGDGVLTGVGFRDSVLS